MARRTVQVHRERCGGGDHYWWWLNYKRFGGLFWIKVPTCRCLSKALSLQIRTGNVLRTDPSCMISSISQSCHPCQKYHENGFFNSSFMHCFGFSASSSKENLKPQSLWFEVCYWAYWIPSHPGSHDCTHKRGIRKNVAVILWKTFKEKKAVWKLAEKQASFPWRGLQALICPTVSTLVICKLVILPMDNMRDHSILSPNELVC